MLDAIRFVQGAVAKKDFVPALTHFRIENGHIRGYNGMLGLCSPIDVDLNSSPRAIPFVKAIQTCQETIQLHMTPTGKLAIRSGPFKVHIDCALGNFPDMEPEGKEIPLVNPLLPALRLLFPFIAEDASRPWARGILFRGNSAYATNNILLIEHWLGSPFPVEINVPKMAVIELLRIGEEPTHLQVSETSIAFHYPHGRWLRTQSYSLAWPELGLIMNRPNEQESVPETLWTAVEALAPFTDDLGRIHLLEGSISTETATENGAIMEVPGIRAGGCFNFKQLLLLKGVAITVDFSTFPKPCIFYGEKLRGAIVGMRG